MQCYAVSRTTLTETDAASIKIYIKNIIWSSGIFNSDGSVVEKKNQWFFIFIVLVLLASFISHD